MAATDSTSACSGCVSAGPVESEATRDGIGRRTFLIQTALLTAAAALAACAVGGDTTSPTLPAGSSIKVSDYSALNTVGGIALVSLNGARLAVVRTADTSYVALSRVCTHEGGIVNPNGSGFLCPNHGAQFNLTGTWIGGQRTSSLHSYSTSFDAATGVLSIS